MSSKPVMKLINPGLYAFVDFMNGIEPGEVLEFPFTDSSGLISESDADSRQHLGVFLHGAAYIGGYNGVCKYFSRRYKSEALEELRSRYGMEENNHRTLFHPFPSDFFDYHKFPKGESFKNFIIRCSTYLNQRRLPQYCNFEGLCALAFELMGLEKIILKVIDTMRLDKKLSPEEGQFPIIKTTQKEVEKAISVNMWEKSRDTVFEEEYGTTNFERTQVGEVAEGMVGDWP
ncbi:hypothetical protein L211DRAFT_846826 [Terfezia boudieri ATCC MYA-4762]|uniref:Uncharacterized protein n=1 Tax=Terfezia boudieri ATCC MYA-4762 TaxID=1051890 RepID=A0A3N4LUQ2_9PEZI|nr:hypothetical protein L211DRAFT_846826 [Terfezia boudieri ATCC MYA-4762]